MNIKEVFQQANITHDTKARRVLNVSPDTKPNIDIDTLNAGVTIEQLESLNVPVLQYGGQITIHGIFNDIPNDRVNGYKSLLHNQNKSLGVKYVAIDNDKKRLLSKVSRYSKSKWHVYINSQGCEVAQYFISSNTELDKQKCIDCYKSTPDTLYIGSKSAVSLWPRGFAVLLNIGAIYQSNLWQLINALTNIPNETEYNQLVEQENQKRELENQEYKLKLEQENIIRLAKLNKAISEFKPLDNWLPFNGNIVNAGIYAQIAVSWIDNTSSLYVYKVKKHGSKIKIASKKFEDFKFVDFEPTEYKIRDSKTINNGWIITEAIQQTVKPVQPITTVKPMITNNITIRHNEKLNGIEVLFNTKPNNTILNALKSLGYRWSNFNKLWYNHFSNELIVKTNELLKG